MFNGFPREIISFLTALSFNNNKAFFEENRDVYTRAVKEPLYAFAEALAPVVRGIDPQLDIRPGRSVSRIHKDLRFSRDKSPYRTYVWIGYRRTGESREETCGFYFDLSPQAVHWGCGYYHMQPPYMERLREKIVGMPDRVLSILENPAFAATFSLLGDSYARQHQPPEHLPEPLKALYQKKNVYAEHRLSDMELLFSPVLADRVAEGFRALAPFYALLRECMR